MPVSDLAPEIAVLLTAVAALLFAVFAPRRWQAFPAVIALAGLALAAVLLAADLGATRFTFSGTWTMDGTGAFVRLMIVGATGLVVLLSPAWFATDARHGEFYAVLLLSALGAMAMAGAGDLLQLVVGVLLSSVTGYALAAWHRDWAISLEAGMKYFLLGALANALLVAGVALVLGLLGTSELEAMAARLSDGEGASPLFAGGVGLLVVALLFKLGAVPGHAWVPDVAEGAPAPVAAFLTVVPKLAAALALARIVAAVPADLFPLRTLLAVAAAATMTLGNLAALTQDDVRRLLGWSSVSQSGYLLMPVCVIGLDPRAAAALLAMAGAYAVGNLAAFAAVVHLRGRTALADYDGLAATRPFAAAILSLSFLSLVGIPPTAGFFGKLEAFVAVIAGGMGWLAVVAAANTVVSLAYYARVMAPMAFREPPRTAAVLSRTSAVALTLAAAAVVLPGLLAGPVLAAFAAATLLP